MDSDQLRLILLVLGVALVVGIYAWDRYKRSRRHGPPIKMARNLEEPDFDLPDFDDDVGEVRVRSSASGARVEPQVDPAPTPAEKDTVAEVEPEPMFLDTPKRRKASSETSAASPVEGADTEVASSLRGIGLQLEEPKPSTEKRPDPMPLDEGMVATRESQFALDLEFNAHGDSDYLNIDSALLDEIPRLIVQINIMHKGHPFTAAQIQHAAAKVDLKYGEMNIFHRETDAGQVLFSMASVVEPGTFPKGKDENFSTPGMTLFTQLPGARDGLAIYSDMLFTAERLSALLDAVLQDERRHKLTKQSIEHTREGIMEHRRQIQLLRSKR